MCTALNYVNGTNHFFGRNLDWQSFYPVSFVITPRNYEFKWRNGTSEKSHYAIIGVGMVGGNYPLYFDGMNEKGLGMAGTAFFGYADYKPVMPDKVNIASFEIIQYILSKCATVEEAKELMKDVNIDNENFSPEMPASQMHWLVGDEKASIVIECTKDNGLKVYDNPFHCLTNAPEFPYQATNVSYYANLSGKEIANRFDPENKDITLFSRGMGTIGLPGGTDSVSRFVREAFTAANSFAQNTDGCNVAEFFHCLLNVQQVNGESEVEGHEYEITQFTSCGDQQTGVYYVSTYYNPTIRGVNMFKEDLDGTDLITYKIDDTPFFTVINE